MSRPSPTTGCSSSGIRSTDSLVFSSALLAATLCASPCPHLVLTLSSPCLHHRPHHRPHHHRTIFNPIVVYARHSPLSASQHTIKPTRQCNREEAGNAVSAITPLLVYLTTQRSLPYLRDTPQQHTPPSPTNNKQHTHNGFDRENASPYV